MSTENEIGKTFQVQGDGVNNVNDEIIEDIFANSLSGQESKRIFEKVQETTSSGHTFPEGEIIEDIFANSL